MTSEVLLFTVQWEPVSRLSPGEAMAMAMAMALAAQQWRRRGGERGNHGSCRGVHRGGVGRERALEMNNRVNKMWSESSGDYLASRRPLR